MPQKAGKSPPKGPSPGPNRQILQALEEFLLEEDQGSVVSPQGRSPGTVAQEGTVTVTPEVQVPVAPPAGREKPSPLLKPRPPQPRVARQKPRSVAAEKPAPRRAFLINILLFGATYGVLYLMLLIPGSVPSESLDFHPELRITLISVPLWLNMGYSLAAIILLARLVFHSPGTNLGLVVGVAVSLTSLLSNSMEGYVLNGMVFGYGVSMICVVFLFMRDLKRHGSVKPFRISFVAGLSVLSILGPAFHFLAACLIGSMVFLTTQMILSACVVLQRRIHR